MKTSSKKNGSLLVIVMVVLVAFSLMTLALLKLGTFSEVETVKQLRHEQARFAAEAGLEKALSQIMADDSARTSRSFGEDLPAATYTAHYEVDITKSNLTLVTDGYTILSTGTVINDPFAISATVQMDMETGPGGQQALLALGGSSTIKNSDIYGTVYQAPPGDLTFEGGSSYVSDIVEAEIAGNPPSDLQAGDLPDPLPGPEVDPNTTPESTAGKNYNDWLEKASHGPFDPDVKQVHPPTASYSGPFNLATASDNSLYVNGNVEIAQNVTGSGKIVVNGTVTVTSNNKSLDDNVTIVAQSDIEVDASNFTFGENATLVTKGNFTLKGNQNFPNPGTSIIALAENAPTRNPWSADHGNVYILANVSGFKGIIYADGRVEFNQGNQEARGTVIAWHGFDIGANATISYDASVFTNPSPVNNLYAITLIEGSWRLKRD